MGTPIIISGMHRSGTSLLANLLQSAGVDIGDRLMEATEFNAKGYFEDMDFYDLHVDILHDNGRYLVYGIGENQDVKISDDFESRAKKLVVERSDRDVWGWKDPRSSLIPDFWARLLPEARFVFIYRDPHLVMDSLRRRADGPLMHQFRGVKLLERFGFDRFSPKLALNMWKYYNRHIVDYAERHPEKCQVIALEDLATEFPQTLKRMNSEWGLSLQDVDMQSVFERKLLGEDAPKGVLKACKRDLEAQTLLLRLKALAKGEVWSGDIHSATSVRKVGGAVVRKYRRLFTPEGRHAARSQKAQAFHGDYNQWLTSFDRPRAKDLDRLKRRVATIEQKPTFWILPKSLSGPKFQRTLATLEAQTWPAWKIVEGDVKELIADGKIKSRDWIMALDYDQLLTTYALQSFAQAVTTYRGAKVIYSDEDRILANDNRLDPFFKPDWAPDFYLESDYISSACICAPKQVALALADRSFSTGSDLVARIVSACADDGVAHIPLALVHVPVDSESASVDREGHIRRLVKVWEGTEVEVESTQDGCHRLVYPLPKVLPLISVIIPTRDRLKELKACITTLLDQTSYPNYEVLVVDNGSEQEDTLTYLKQIEEEDRVTILRDPSPFNFSAINNKAVTSSHGDILCFLNDDTRIISESWLTDMARLALRQRVGAVGAMLYYGDGTIQHAGVVTGSGGARLAGHPFRCLKPEAHPENRRLHHVQNYSVVTGACLMVRKEVFASVGGFPEELSVCFNDVDLCLKIRKAGYRNLWTPHVELFHDENVSYAARTEEAQVRYERESNWLSKKWQGSLVIDPAFNPNLALSGEIGALAANPRFSRPWK